MKRAARKGARHEIRHLRHGSGARERRCEGSPSRQTIPPTSPNRQNIGNGKSRDDGGLGQLSDASEGIARPAVVGSVPALGLSALGVVFGDIGTSPLYTLKTVLGRTAGTPDAAVTLGVLSLVVWTLIVVTTIKYVSRRDERRQ